MVANVFITTVQSTVEAYGLLIFCDCFFNVYIDMKS